jgi:GxxExxY protein
MNHGARGVPGARGEAAGGLAAGYSTGGIIRLAIKVHKTLGLDVSSRFMRIACALNGLGFQRQVELSLIDDGVRLPRAYRADIVVGEIVILEIKSIDRSCRFTRRSFWPICS